MTLTAEQSTSFPLVAVPSAPAFVGSVALSQGVELPDAPLADLPPALEDFVRALAVATQTPQDLAFGMVLAAVSAVAQGTAVIECTEGWEEELPVWFIVALPSGERKSAVLRATTRPIRDAEAEHAENVRPGVAMAEARREALEGRVKAVTRKVADGKAEADELDEAVQQLEDAPKFHVPRLLVDDATPEAVAGVMAAGNSSLAVLAAESPFADNLGGRYSDGRANLHLTLQSYSGEPATVDRRGREPERIERPLLTIGMTIQPHVLDKMTGTPEMVEQGFLARAAVIVPKSRVGLRDTDPPPVPEHIAAAYTDCISRLYTSRQRDTTDAIPSGSSSVGCVATNRTLHFTQDAAEAFRDWRATHELRLGPDGDLAPIAAWANRHPGRVARVAALLHLAEHDRELEVPIETFAAATRIGEYLAVHALNALSSDPVAAMAAHAGTWLKGRRGEVVSVRDLHRGPAGGGHGSSDRAREVADRLERQGLLRRRPDPERTGGRPPSPSYDVLDPNEGVA